MLVEPGRKLLHYELAEQLGEGGMGVVWRALDTTLDREVAIKVLPDEFAADTDRLARFEREAKLLAALNHPNIAAIHGLHEFRGLRFLTMELVPGESLAARLLRGPVPLEETLELASQIAEALSAAHTNGIVHRDLKPANVQITPAGRVKVLDFGLAKVLEAASGETPADATRSPTLTLQSTALGTILGTAAYMSPEQARGQPTDKCADLWSFGVVVWEMLTGERLFVGETVSDTLAAVLRAEPDWDRMPPVTPEPLRRLLRRCLERAPRDRLQDATDARLELRDAATAAAEGPSAADRPASRSIFPWVLFVATLIVAGVLAGSIVFREPLRSLTLAFELPPPDGQTFKKDDAPVILSPDGTRIAAGTYDRKTDAERLAVRRLDELDYRLLPIETSMWNAFWSPDGQSLGFFAWRTEKLMKIDLRGGPPVELADADAGRGATWNEDGVIVFSPNPTGPLYRVDAMGGPAVPVTTLDTDRGETGHVRPQFLPGGRRFLYHAVHPGAAGPEASDSAGGESSLSLRVGSLDGDPPRGIPGSFERAVSYASGFVLYQTGGTLMARRLDLRSLAWRGEPMIVARELDQNREYLFASFSVSGNGVLAYHRAYPTFAEQRLVRRDRRGVLLSETAVPGNSDDIDLSPDGRRLAMEREDGSKNVDIWITDLDRNVDQRFTFDAAAETAAVWSPKSDRLAYARHGTSSHGIFIRAASGAGTERQVFESAEWIVAMDWSPDGKLLLCLSWPESGDTWALPVEGGGESLAVASTAFDEHAARFSPDGKWISYQSNETGRDEIYVRSWPDERVKWRVSNAGGKNARWRADGSEIYYKEPGPRGRLMVAAVRIDDDGSFRTDPPELLFESDGHEFEPMPDGQAFLLLERVREVDTRLATLVVNWQALLAGEGD